MMEVFLIKKFNDKRKRKRKNEMKKEEENRTVTKRIKAEIYNETEKLIVISHVSWFSIQENEWRKNWRKL